MGNYLKSNFYQEKEEIGKEIIDNKHRNNIKDWDTEIDNVSNEIKIKRENPRLYKLLSKPWR